jgi:hypothetical protein
MGRKFRLRKWATCGKPNLRENFGAPPASSSITKDSQVRPTTHERITDSAPLNPAREPWSPTFAHPRPSSEVRTWRATKQRVTGEIHYPTSDRAGGYFGCSRAEVPCSSHALPTGVFCRRHWGELVIGGLCQLHPHHAFPYDATTSLRNHESAVSTRHAPLSSCPNAAPSNPSTCATRGVEASLPLGGVLIRGLHTRLEYWPQPFKNGREWVQ